MRTDPATVEPGRSFGLLDETLDLLARARRGLGAIDGPRERVVRIASKSKPGEFNEVTTWMAWPAALARGSSAAATAHTPNK